MTDFDSLLNYTANPWRLNKLMDDAKDKGAKVGTLVTRSDFFNELYMLARFIEQNSQACNEPIRFIVEFDPKQRNMVFAAIPGSKKAECAAAHPGELQDVDPVN